MANKATPDKNGSVRRIATHFQSPRHKLQKAPSWRSQSPKTQFPRAPIHGARCPANWFQTRTRSQMSEMQSFCTWATSGPPESPWQASIPSSPAQIIVAESAKCFFNIWLKGVNFIPIAPLYALLQSLSLCIGTRAFRGTKFYADEEQTVWLCQQYFSCPRYFLSPAFYAIGSHYPPWGGLWKVVRHSRRFFPSQ